MGLGSGIDLGEVNILRLPTIVANAKGETVIRGFHRTSLGVKLEVEVKTGFLFDIETTIEPTTLHLTHAVIPPLDPSKHKKALKQVGNTN